jgi:hypothetical protein
MLACISLVSCAEKQVNLGAGYKYVQLDGVNAAIADRDSHMVVDPNVKRYRVIGSYIVGERVNADIDVKLSKNFGYFIFDMRNGQLLEGLDKAKFDQELRARKLEIAPF